MDDRKLKAIDLIVAGVRPGEVADTVGISRTQLWRWLREPDVQARLEIERASVHQARIERLFALYDKATQVAEQSLDEGDPKMAVDILRLTGRAFTDVAWVTLPDESVAELPPSQEDVTPGYGCETCGKVCRTLGALGSHMRAHS